MPSTTTFAACPGCQTCWSSPRAFLDAAAFELVGFSANPEHPSEGRVHFVHADDDCGAPFTLPVGLFLPWMHAPRSAESLYGTNACPGLCDTTFCLEPCDADCVLAAVRGVLGTLDAATEARIRMMASSDHG